MIKAKSIKIKIIQHLKLREMGKNMLYRKTYQKEVWIVIKTHKKVDKECLLSEVIMIQILRHLLEILKETVL